MDNELTFDKEGFLTTLDLWNEDVAHKIAKQEGLTLSREHFDVIYLLRDFYQKHEVAPANRPLVKLVKTQISEDKGNSIYLMTLFPESPAKIGAKIAGLPKPPNCL
jgi:tRNA 2-thiouridine synthesizing protein E